MRGQAKCPCGFVGPARNITNHRGKCYQWRKHKRKLVEKEQRQRESRFVLTPI